MSSEVEDSDDEEYEASSAPTSEVDPSEGADSGGSDVEDGSDRGTREQGHSGSLAEGAPGQAHARQSPPLSERAAAVPRGRKESAPSARLKRADERAIYRPGNRARRVVNRAGIANANVHVALLVINASGTKVHQNVIGNPALAAHFRQPRVRASLEAAVAAQSSERRALQRTAESVATAALTHEQKQAYCARVASNARKDGVVGAFTDPLGCWPAGWNVPRGVRFANPHTIRAWEVCEVAGKSVKQIDALLEALATHAAIYAPSEQELAERPACVTNPLVFSKLLLRAVLTI